MPTLETASVDTVPTPCCLDQYVEQAFLQANNKIDYSNAFVPSYYSRFHQCDI